MDAETKNALDQIAGAITAQRFMIENLYALIISRDADPLVASKATAENMLRQFNLAPVGKFEPSDQVYAIHQHAIEYMELFWNSVQERLKTARAD
jgi:hypothetical protein